MHAKTLLPSLRWALAAAALALAAGCNSTAPKVKVYQDEGFESSETFSRLFDASVDLTCEAARRALLSQGYVVLIANADLVNARKNFQPENETHVQIEFRVVCTAQRKGARPTLAFVTALQERYALKKSNNSASVGVGAIGSLSLPFTSGDDSLVKVASETITASSFYDRFFKLVGSYMVVEPDPVAMPVPPLGLPPPAAAASAASQPG